MIVEFSKYKEPKVGDWIIINPHKNKYATFIIDYITYSIFKIVKIDTQDGVSGEYAVDMDISIGDIIIPNEVSRYARIHLDRSEIIHFGEKEDMLEKMNLLKNVDKYNL